MVLGTKAHERQVGKFYLTRQSKSLPLHWALIQRWGGHQAGIWQVSLGGKYPVGYTSPLIFPPPATPTHQAWERYRTHNKEKVLDCDPLLESSCRSSCRSMASTPARPGSVGEAASSHYGIPAASGEEVTMGTDTKGLKLSEKRLEAMVKRQRRTSSNSAAILLTLTIHIYCELD